MSDQISYATYAEYFRLGLKAEILSPQDAQSWAFRIMKAIDRPSAEIGEIALSPNLEALLDFLAEVGGDSDQQLAVNWLVGLLIRRALADPTDCVTIRWQAWEIFRETNQPEAKNLDDIFSRWWGLCCGDNGGNGWMPSDEEIAEYDEMMREELVDMLAEYPAQFGVCQGFCVRDEIK